MGEVSGLGIGIGIGIGVGVARGVMNIILHFNRSFALEFGERKGRETISIGAIWPSSLAHSFC